MEWKKRYDMVQEDYKDAVKEIEELKKEIRRLKRLIPISHIKGKKEAK